MRRLICASLLLLVSGFLLQPSTRAADKIRISFTLGTPDTSLFLWRKKEGSYERRDLKLRSSRSRATWRILP